MATATTEQSPARGTLGGITTQIKVKQAVLYLRVSTPGQVHTDYDPEGISLPAQRKACTRKAEQLGMSVVGEYMEAGVSGRGTQHRLEFQKMLARIKTQKDVDCVIVHKLSRLARNRIDEALVMDQFNRLGVTLVSATEPIDNTPEGQFMQGILSSMAQFRSQQDGEDIAYKMGEKAKNGGTIGRAPIGYLNTREIVDGHEVRTVKPDPERAPFIREAFIMYRDGATLQHICDELGARGFTSKARRNHPSGPMTDGGLATLLHDPYYIGFVKYKGQLYPGRHEPLISQELFDQVQTASAGRRVNGPRQRIHNHYLKGMLWCGTCHEHGLERRMILNRSHGKGGIYWHYFCNGRNFNTDRHQHAPYVQVALIETAVARYYQQVGFTHEFIDAMEQELERTIQELNASDQLAKEQSERQAAKLKVQEERLLQLAMDGTLSKDLIRSKLNRIRIDQAKLKTNIDSITDNVKHGADTIRQILHFLENLGVWYNHPLTPAEAKQQLNAAIFKKIYVYYDQASEQTEIKDTQYVDDIQQLKDLERQFTRTGRIGYDQAASQNKTSQQDLKRLTRTSNTAGQNIASTPQANADTLDKLTRTRNPKQPENADNTIKTRENPEQNGQNPVEYQAMGLDIESPENGGITGVTAAQRTKNPPTDNAGETGSNKAFMVRQTGFEPATC